MAAVTKLHSTRNMIVSVRLAALPPKPPAFQLLLLLLSQSRALQLRLPPVQPLALHLPLALLTPARATVHRTGVQTQQYPQPALLQLLLPLRRSLGPGSRLNKYLSQVLCLQPSLAFSSCSIMSSGLQERPCTAGKMNMQVEDSRRTQDIAALFNYNLPVERYGCRS